MKKKEFIAAVDELGVNGGAAIHAVIQGAVRAVIPGKQQARNLEPQMVLARKAALRALRHYVSKLSK